MGESRKKPLLVYFLPTFPSTLEFRVLCSRVPTVSFFPVQNSFCPTVFFMSFREASTFWLSPTHGTFPNPLDPMLKFRLTSFRPLFVPIPTSFYGEKKGKGERGSFFLLSPKVRHFIPFKIPGKMPKLGITLTTMCLIFISRKLLTVLEEEKSVRWNEINTFGNKGSSVSVSAEIYLMSWKWREELINHEGGWRRLSFISIKFRHFFYLFPSPEFWELLRKWRSALPSLLRFH